MPSSRVLPVHLKPFPLHPLHLRQLVPGTLAALLVAAVVGAGGWQPLEFLVYNWQFRLRGARPWSDRIAVIVIDENSLQEFGRFPISRRYYAELLDILQPVEPDAVIFDIAFSELEPNDELLGDRMDRLGRAVIAQATDYQGRLLQPSPEVEASAAALGDITKLQDIDGITRQVPLSRWFYDSNAETLTTASDTESSDTESLEIAGDRLPTLSVAALELHGFLEEPLVPLPDLSQPLWVNWPSSTLTHLSDSTLMSVSLADVLSGSVAAESFRDRFVFVGVTARGLDPLQTPFDRTPETSGIYMHAATLNTLLLDNELQRPRWWMLVMIGILAGPAFGWAIAPYSARWRLLLGVAAIGAWIPIAIVGFQTQNWWLPMAWPVSLLALSTAAVELGERLATNRRLERQLNQLWASYGEDLIQHSPLPLQITEISDQFQQPQRVADDTVSQLTTLAAAFGRSQSAQAAISSSLPIGLVATDLEGIVWFCNPVAAEVLSIQEGDRLMAALVPEWTTTDVWTQRWQALADGFHGESWDVKRFGHWFDLKVEPLLAQITGRMSGVLLVVEDTTASRELQEQLVVQNRELEIARQEAEAATHMKSAFLANMSHEIRTPMNAVVGLAGLLLDTQLNAEQQDFIRTIRSSGDTLLGIINEILDFSKLEAKSVRLEAIEFHLLPCIEAVADLLATQAYAKGLDVAVRVKPDVPLKVVGDPTRIGQILTNLLGNAIKFTASGHVTLEVQILQRSPQTATEPELATLRFGVRDTGIGIEAQAQQTLFDSFSQADASTTRKYGGTGLGLAICKGLVELMGGEIGVDSVLGEGSTFWFQLTLPVESMPVGSMPVGSMNEQETDRSHQQCLQAVPLWIATDCGEVGEAIAEWAHNWGMRVTVSERSVALERLRKIADNPATGEWEGFVAIDLDWEHSDDWVGALQALPADRRPHCMGLAPLTRQDRIKAWVKAGQLDAAISKPVKPERVLATILQIVRPDTQPRSPQAQPSVAPPSPANLRILLAEDNRVNQKVAVRQLKTLGYSAEVATNGREVLDALDSQEFDVVLMDCQMPVMDGYEATITIRERETEGQRIPIIAMTASALEDDRDRCLAVGMDDFLSKPVRKSELQAVLQKWGQSRLVD
ncbi:MAG: CHASE2 domain-containing protein [Cyanobacteria bacterium J06642_12]